MNSALQIAEADRPGSSEAQDRKDGEDTGSGSGIKNRWRKLLIPSNVFSESSRY